MDNQHKKLKGRDDLSQEEDHPINEEKQWTEHSASRLKTEFYPCKTVLKKRNHLDR